MPEADFIGLAEHVQAVFKPHFTDVLRRTGRRRLRGRIAGAAVVTVAGVGVAGMSVSLLPASGGSVAAAPSGLAGTSEILGYRPLMSVGDLAHLYLTYTTDRACQGADCVFMLAASADRGATWQRFRVPIPTGGALSGLTPLGPATLLASWSAPLAGGGGYLASTDAGRTWHAVTVRTVGSIPTGWRPVYGGDSSGYPQTAAVLVADPATGDVVRLAPEPAVSAGALVTNLPASAGLWLTGNDLLPVPTGSHAPEEVKRPNGDTVHLLRGPGTVAVSHDGGRSWQRSRFPDMNNGYNGGNPPTVATYDGRTAYVLVVKGDTVVVYRSVDGGVTWAPTGANLPTTRGQFGSVSAAAVRPDGTLLIQLTTGPTDTAYASTDGGRTLHTLRDDHVTAVPVPGGYAQVDSGTVQLASGGDAQVDPGRGYWLSTDGISGTWISPPNTN